MAMVLCKIVEKEDGTYEYVSPDGQIATYVYCDDCLIKSTCVIYEPGGGCRAVEADFGSRPRK